MRYMAFDNSMKWLQYVEIIKESLKLGFRFYVGLLP